MRIATAQSVSAPGDIQANVLVHTRFIAAAHEAAVDLVVSPELSLSGYELPLFKGCLVQPDNECLAPIRDMAWKKKMTVIVGAPIATGADAPSIGAITFFPDGKATVYRKQYLHPGEEKFVAKGGAGSRSHATKFNVGVLMANHGGPSGGFLSAGKSAFWAPGGKLVVVAPGTGNFLAIASRKSGAWNGELLTLGT